MESQRTGRALLFTCIGLTLVLSVGVIVFYLANRGTDRLPAQLVRLALTGVLCFFLYRGSEIARWLSVVLFTLGGALAAPGLLQESVPGMIVTGVMAAVYLAVAGVLLWSRRVHAFMDHQRRSAGETHDTVREG